MLYLVSKRLLEGREGLETLFCPGDLEESLRQAGGPAAYEGFDVDAPGDLGHLTSYAGRALTEPACRAAPGRGKAVVLVADDSGDHHDGRGIVVGFTGGAARFQDKVDVYGLTMDTPLTVGEDSPVEELRCLRTE